MLSDQFGRRIDYLRLSVTDHCNLRCSYCIPLGWKLPFPSQLTFGEIERLVRILAALGIHRVRLTGGEPLLRKHLPTLIEKLSRIDNVEILLTTNGILLGALARELKQAGLRRINIHLDTLNPKKFREITRWGEIQNVFTGIAAAREAGLLPIKLNTVIQKGVNDDEVLELICFAKRERLLLRFIELMPIGPAREMMVKRFVPLSTIRSRLGEKYRLTPQQKDPGSGPAVIYRIEELETDVGFISAVSKPFCETCNRIRISADGRFQDCLAYDGDVSFRELIRDPGISDEILAEKIQERLQGKREGHNGFIQPEGLRTPCMYGIGG